MRFSKAVKTVSFAVAALTLALLVFGSFPNVMAANDPTGRGVGYSAVLYDNTSGLPTSDVNAVVQTDAGFIWIGSYSGLIRYDGNEFYRYDSSTGVSSVVSLFADSKGRLWIGTNDSGVFVLEKEEFSSYDREEGLRSSSVRSIIEDKDGNILVATTMGMAYIGTDGVMRTIDDPQINREYICEFVSDDAGVIYGVTNSGSFFTVENLRLTAFYEGSSFGFGTLNTVYPDPEQPGYLYIGTQNATVVHGRLDDIESAKIYSVAPQHDVRAIRKFDGSIWICADTGIGFLEGDTYVPLLDLPMNNSVEHMMRDFEDNLWFTSSRQGLLKIVRNRFTDISSYAELEPAVVNSTRLKDGLLYVGTDNGLILIDGNYDKVENEITKMFEGVRIRSIHETTDGTLWFGTNSKLGLLNLDTKTGNAVSYNSENGLASDRARTMKELSDGRIAVATNAGVNVIENGKITALYNAAHGISNLEILCLEEAPDGSILAGSDGDGIYVIGGGKVVRIGRDDGLRSEVILRLRADPVEEGLFWIITSNSIAYLRDGKVTTVKNFPYSNNFDMYFDEHAKIWILSSNGIYVVKREDMFTDEKIDYTHFDTSSGLPCSATANSYSCLAPDGTLYIAASTGVSSVNINAIYEEKDTVRLSIPYLTADDKYIEIVNGRATVPADCKRLKICAYAFSYSLNDPHVRYTLEGFDDGSTELSRHEMRPVTYTNLPGGDYVFRFSLLDTMTGSERQSISVSIVKEKTLFEYVWFRIMLTAAGVLVLVALVFFYYRRKTKILLKKQEEHKQFINEMTDVFASCIDMKDHYTNGHSHRVAKYTAMLAEKLGKSPEEVEKMHRIALLHDIGKIGIPDSILNKPGRLDDDEFKVMKSHSQRGYDILKEISIAPELSLGAGYHHERLDGRGYPNGLTKDEIPEVAKIIAVADTFDAMYSTRPYRRRMELPDIVAEIKRCSGTQLDENVVGALMKLIDEGAFDNDRPD